MSGEQSNGTYETEDLALSAYLKMRGMELTNYESPTGGGKIRFTFADPEGIGKKLSLEFLNSDCKKFDSEVRDLKKFLR